MVGDPSGGSPAAAVGDGRRSWAQAVVRVGSLTVIRDFVSRVVCSGERSGEPEPGEGLLRILVVASALGVLMYRWELTGLNGLNEPERPCEAVRSGRRGRHERGEEVFPTLLGVGRRLCPCSALGIPPCGARWLYPCQQAPKTGILFSAHAKKRIAISERNA